MDYPIGRNKKQLVKEIASIIIITDFIINFFLCQVKLRVLLGIFCFYIEYNVHCGTNDLSHTLSLVWEAQTPACLYLSCLSL